MSQCSTIRPRDKAESFSDDYLAAVIQADRYEPSAADFRDWELHEEYLQMLAEEGIESPNGAGFGTFGLDANEAELI